MTLLDRLKNNPAIIPLDPSRNFTPNGTTIYIQGQGFRCPQCRELWTFPAGAGKRKNVEICCGISFVQDLLGEHL